MDSGNIKENNLDHVTGVTERVTFHSPESGFAVLRVKVRGRRDLVTIERGGNAVCV
jgi:exodeoxyribonuclease V alpha subunit